MLTTINGAIKIADNGNVVLEIAQDDFENFKSIKT